MTDFPIIIAEWERNGPCVGSVSSLGGNGKSQGGSARANTGSGGTGRGLLSQRLAAAVVPALSATSLSIVRRERSERARRDGRL